MFYSVYIFVPIVVGWNKRILDRAGIVPFVFCSCGRIGRRSYVGQVTLTTGKCCSTGARLVAFTMRRTCCPSCAGHGPAVPRMDMLRPWPRRWNACGRRILRFMVADLAIMAEQTRAGLYGICTKAFGLYAYVHAFSCIGAARPCSLAQKNHFIIRG